MPTSTLQVGMDTSNWFESCGVEEENAISSVPSSPASVGEMITCSSTSGMEAERRIRPTHEQALNCPRCDSTHTKFCYYNNYSLSQPRYFCKTCRRYWTKGGTLRNVPVGGGCRKNKKLPSSSFKKGPPNVITAPGPDDGHPPHGSIIPTTSTDLHLATHGIPSFAHFNSFLQGNSDAMECKAAMPMFTGENYMISTPNLDGSKLDLMMGISASSPAGSYYSFNQINGSSDESYVGSRGGSCNSVPFGIGMDPFGSSELYHHESSFRAESNIGSQHKLMQQPTSIIGAHDEHANTIDAKPSLLALDWHGHGHQFTTSYTGNLVFGKDSLNFNPVMSGIGGWPGVMNIDAGAYISSSTPN